MEYVNDNWERKEQELDEQIAIVRESLWELLTNMAFAARKILSEQDLDRQMALAGLDFADTMKDWMEKGNLSALRKWHDLNAPREGDTDLCRLVGLYLTLKEQKERMAQ